METLSRKASLAFRERPARGGAPPARPEEKSQLNLLVLNRPEPSVDLV